MDYVKNLVVLAMRGSSPESYNLKNNIDYCCNDNCKACWLNAIKDIKFKGDKNE